MENWYIKNNDAMITQFWNELIAVTTITIIAVVTPGADFVVVIKNSLSGSQRSGIFTAFGISTAIWIHTFYTIAGIGLIIASSLYLYSIIKIVGAIYLIYLGISSIRNKEILNTILTDEMGLSNWKSFQSGFITNLFNPKATMFYVSVFTQVVSTKTPIIIQLFYGFIISLSCFFWFSFVSIFLNNEKIKLQFLKSQKPIEKFMGVVLIGFGIKVAFSEIG